MSVHGDRLLELAEMVRMTTLVLQQGVRLAE